MEQVLHLQASILEASFVSRSGRMGAIPSMKAAERTYNKPRNLLQKRHQVKLNKLKENPRAGRTCIMYIAIKRKNRRFRRNIRQIGTASTPEDPSMCLTSRVLPLIGQN